jgi:dihydroorotate dehydrogenase (fumarate)
MDLTTRYMGLKLKNPLVLSASPLTHDLENYRKLEDEGVAAIVTHSIFEEQIREEANELDHYMTFGTEKFAESLSFFPKPSEFILGPEEYLNHLRKAKKAVDIPVIASLNGYTLGGWTEYAKLIQEAGADALELNIYFLPTDPEETGEKIEKTYLSILKAVKDEVKIPVALKLSPFFSSMANMAKKLDAAGADGLVLFNRFYQPDIDLDTLEVVPNLIFSTSQAMRLPLTWIAILYGQLKASLAATGGIHEAQDAIKMILVGADVTMVCAALLEGGVGHAKKILSEMEEWMEKNEYESVKQMKGILSQKSCPDPQAFERANYMKAIKDVQPDI